MITKEQKENMEHALGLNYQKYPYRNKFCTYEIDESWQDLIKKGLADVSITKSENQTYYFYYVTKKGQEYLGLKCECSELGCQNKFYKMSKLSPTKEIPMCRRHYYEYR